MNPHFSMYYIKSRRRKLVRNTTSNTINYFQVQEVANELTNISYMECSSRRGEGVNLVFDKAVSIALAIDKNTKPKRKYCVLL